MIGIKSATSPIRIKMILVGASNANMPDARNTIPKYTSGIIILILTSFGIGLTNHNEPPAANARNDTTQTGTGSTISPSR